MSRNDPEWQYSRGFNLLTGVAFENLLPLLLAQLISENTLCPPFFFCILLEAELDALLLSEPRESVVAANTTDIFFVNRAFYLLVTFSLHIIFERCLDEVLRDVV